MYEEYLNLANNTRAKVEQDLRALKAEVAKCKSTELEITTGNRRLMIHSPQSSAMHEYTAEDDLPAKSHVDNGEGIESLSFL